MITFCSRFFFFSNETKLSNFPTKRLILRQNSRISKLRKMIFSGNQVQTKFLMAYVHLLNNINGCWSTPRTVYLLKRYNLLILNFATQFLIRVEILEHICLSLLILSINKYIFYSLRYLEKPKGSLKTRNTNEILIRLCQIYLKHVRQNCLSRFRGNPQFIFK